MATLHWQRDLTSDVNGVKNTYSSWDNCMAKGYCKWPAIIGIIIGSLIVLSLLTCLFRCLCCGMQCCCGCLSCFNACCPSPRRRPKQAQEYQQPPPQPYQQPHPPYQKLPPQPAQQPYPQYQSAPSPKYAAGGYRGPQTATFDAPSKQSAPAPAHFNEDALPAMPGWDTAVSKHVQEEPEDVEMEKLDHANPHQTPLHDQSDGGRYYGQQNQQAFDDPGAAYAQPYRDYDQHRQFVPSSPSMASTPAYPPTYHTSPTNTVYAPSQQWDAGRGYAPSVPPSYRTGPPSVVSPPPQQQSFGTIGRRPVQGSWRDI